MNFENTFTATIAGKMYCGKTGSDLNFPDATYQMMVKMIMR